VISMQGGSHQSIYRAENPPSALSRKGAIERERPVGGLGGVGHLSQFRSQISAGGGMRNVRQALLSKKERRC
jgi:hypothetical protein